MILQRENHIIAGETQYYRRISHRQKIHRKMNEVDLNVPAVTVVEHNDQPTYGGNECEKPVRCVFFSLSADIFPDAVEVSLTKTIHVSAS